MKKKVLRRIVRKLTFFVGTIIYRLKPIDNYLFVFQSEGDFWDNARALYEYMISNNINKKFKLVWLVDEPSLYNRFYRENVEFIKTNPINLKEIIHERKIMCTARYFFFTHRGYKNARKTQTVVNLWHGSIVLKAIKGTPVLYKTFDYQCSTSHAAAERMGLFTGMKKEQAIINGDCRQDYLFSNCEEKVKAFLGNGYDQYILGMPTFKKTKTWTDAMVNSWVLPIIKNQEQFNELNSFCKTENILLVIKIHHLEDISLIDASSTTNIRVIKDEDLQNADIQLYELIGKTDALLTDFSSVAYDYMLLDKPIGYMITEMHNYSRGFIIDNIQDEMAGEKISTIGDLQEFIRGVKNGIDNYKDARKKIVDKFFVYKKDGNCERLLKFLKIQE